MRERAGRNNAQENCPLKRCMGLCKAKEIIYKAESFPSAVRRVLETLHIFIKVFKTTELSDLKLLIQNSLIKIYVIEAIFPLLSIPIQHCK